jgi:hypothetical protein
MLSIFAQQVTASVRVTDKHAAGAQEAMTNHVQIDGSARRPVQQDYV